MKKMLAIVLVLVLSVSLVACTTDKQASGDSYKIGFVISTQTNPFFVTLKEGAESKAKELGVELIVLDSQDDPAKEMSNIEDLITKKVNLILINPTDSDAVVNGVIAANEAKIPVITVDRASNGGEVLSYIASDNVAGGEMAGEFIIDKLGGRGNIVELEGIAGTNAARERGEGFNKVLEGTDLKIVAKQTADFDRVKGLAVMENILQSQHDIQAIFAHNDEMALGALEANKASGRNILVVGFDATDDALKAVNDGQMAATIAQQPDLIGKTGVELAVKYLEGEKINSNVPVELSLVIK